jgi:Bacterial regulatory helix-turn-helix protein, lysR family
MGEAFRERYIALFAGALQAHRDPARSSIKLSFATVRGHFLNRPGDKRMLENRHLRYFIEVARSLHVRRAAERLHIAQPALTQNIQQLESELGVELFHRESRHLRLTEAGQVFLVEAEQSLRQFDHAQKTAQRAARGEVGSSFSGSKAPRDSLSYRIFF